ncbi:MAG: 16S rRNA (cytidine(1402)-2'-O)-methyltransferase [Sphingomonadales bacterium]
MPVAHAPSPSPPPADYPPGLYLVATPIGNLGDITARALECLAQADLILCEDSRVTGRLLKHFGIDAPMLAYHDHNAARLRPQIIARLQHDRIALVSDAGTPLINDPGYKLVRDARAGGRHVAVLPGVSAPIAALCLSGLPSDRFLFAGFAPAKTAARRRFYQEFASLQATLLVFETAPRLAASLADAAAVLGSRPAAICRELTKLHEQVIAGGLDDLAAQIAAQPVKGEIVLVIAPPKDERPVLDDAAIDDRLRRLLRDHGVRDAAALLAAETGLPRKRLYARALALAASHA